MVGVPVRFELQVISLFFSLASFLVFGTFGFECFPFCFFHSYPEQQVVPRDLSVQAWICDGLSFGSRRCGVLNEGRIPRLACCTCLFPLFGFPVVSLLLRFSLIVVQWVSLM